MMKRIISVFTLTLILSSVAFGQQSGKIFGKVKDKNSGEGLPFTIVVAFQNGIQKGSAESDFDGNYSISGLLPGTYDIKAQAPEYKGFSGKGISLAPGASYKYDVKMTPLTEATELGVEVVTIIRDPIVGRDGPKNQGKSAEQIADMGARTISEIAAQTGGAVAADDGEAVNLKGARNGAAVYIDGVKVIGSAGLPAGAIERLDVMTNVSAQFGDVTGGVINITSKGASRETRGGLQYETSRLFDQWNTDVASFNVSGPLATVPALDEKGNKIYDKDSNVVKDVKLGYFLAAQYQGARDVRPSPIGIYQVKDDVFTDITTNPLYKTSTGYAFRADQLMEDDLEIVKVRPNTQGRNLSLNGKIDYQINENTTFTVGGRLNYQTRRGYSNLGGFDNGYIFRYSLLNYNSNPLLTRNSYGVYGRLRQSFKEDSNSVIKNAFYQVQVDFSKDYLKVEDPNHKDNVFRYGHVGKFTFKERGADVQNFEHWSSVADSLSWIENDPTYEDVKFYYSDAPNADGTYDLNQITLDAEGNEVHTKVSTVDAETKTKGLFLQVNEGTKGMQYERSEYNDLASNNLEHFFTLEEAAGASNDQFADLISKNMYFNGVRAPLVGNGLWYSSGRPYGGFSYNDNSQFRISGLMSAEITKKASKEDKDEEEESGISSHAITLGFEYEQRDFRSYSVNPLGLWAQGRNELNQQFTTGDGSYIYDYTNELSSDVYLGETYKQYAYATTGGLPQTTFDKNVREQLGYGELEFINIDEIDPDELSIDMFDANTLMQQRLVGYQGYDYTGKRVSNKGVEFEDFFTDPSRPQGSFNPIYSAFFIEDKFEVSDLIIRFGLRVDRYDANQRVLKDRYSTSRLTYVGETNLNQFNDGTFETPGNVEDDWAIYVDKTAEGVDINNGTEQAKFNVVGFRDGTVWYDASGNEVRNPSFFSNSSVINPWLDSYSGANADPDAKALYDGRKITLDAFEDYKPQINVMPRLAFSFPINEEAGFYAHYDVLTQRPTGTSVTPSSFYFLNTGSGTFLNNPNLKPTQRINYQLGYQQQISPISAITLEAYYNETRNQIAFTRVNYAYPSSYTTLENLDLGTSKGLTFQYDLRRKERGKGFRMNLTYTLAFSEGTGSSTGTAQALIGAGFDNLKVPFPLNFDQRHTISSNMDYRFGSNKMKKAKETKEGEEAPAQKKSLLSDVGINYTMVASSGRPFTKYSSTQTEVLIGSAGNSILDGTPNGSRLPWTFRGTVRIDKDVTIRKPKFEEVDGKKKMVRPGKDINVYVYVQNVFNNKNVLQVYNNTGKPDDDGYLVTLPEGSITDSEIMLYNAALQNPSYYSLPRRARLGVTYSF